MAFDAFTAQPTSGQNPWYTTMDAWMDSVETAIGQTDDGWEAHVATATVHVPSGGSAGHVLTKVTGTTGDYAWAAPSAGGASDHGALTGLSDPDHPIAAVVGLQAALDGKSASGHTHAYEPTGTAAAAVTAHEALGDPHPTYLTAAEGAAAYAPLAQAVPASGTTGHVLTKTGGGFAWAAPTGGTTAPPVSFTGTDIATVPLTVKGASGQTANIFETRLNDNTISLGVTATGEVRSGTNIANQNGVWRLGVNDPARQGLMIRLATSQTAKAMQVTDQGLTEVFSVAADGTVAGKNIGAPVLVLNAADAIPSTTLAGTVILRRPA